MRFILLAIFVLFAAQPLPVAACDMHDGQATSSSPADTMPDGPMDHDGQKMDCCDQDQGDDGCNSLSHCATCPMGLAAIAPSAPSMGEGLDSPGYQPATGIQLNRTASPPFRPPIA